MHTFRIDPETAIAQLLSMKNTLFIPNVSQHSEKSSHLFVTSADNSHSSAYSPLGTCQYTEFTPQCQTHHFRVWSHSDLCLWDHRSSLMNRHGGYMLDVFIVFPWKNKNVSL